MVYKLILYENFIERTGATQTSGNRFAGVVHWERRFNLIPDDFEIAVNTLSLGDGRFIVKMDYDQWKQIQAYRWLAVLYDDRGQPLYFGVVKGMRGDLQDQDWKIEIYTVEMLDAFEPIYDLNPIFSRVNFDQETLYYFYRSIFLDTYADIGWDRGVNEIKIHAPDQQIPLESGDATSYVPYNQPRSVKQWILDVSRLAPPHQFRFLIKQYGYQINGFTFETSYNFSNLYPRVDVEFTQKSGRIVGMKDASFENMYFVWTKNYWNKLRLRAVPEGSVQTAGTTYIMLPASPHGPEIIPQDVETEGVVEGGEITVEEENRTTMKVEKQVESKLSKDEVENWKALAGDLLQQGLQGNHNLQAVYIGGWDKLNLYQRVRFKFRDIIDEYIVTEKRLNAKGITTIKFGKLDKDDSIIRL